jgi:hypothetical protein
MLQRLLIISEFYRFLKYSKSMSIILKNQKKKSENNYQLEPHIKTSLTINITIKMVLSKVKV